MLCVFSLSIKMQATCNRRGCLKCTFLISVSAVRVYRQLGDVGMVSSIIKVMVGTCQLLSLLSNLHFKTLFCPKTFPLP